MKRKAIVVDLNIHGTTIVAIDSSCVSDILKYIFTEKIETEFKEIRDILKQNIRNKEKYCKANVSNKASNMFEMRFTRNGKNDRIYCQEMHIKGKRHIIMCELFVGKKTQDIPNKIKSRIETMGGYEYEIE